MLASDHIVHGGDFDPASLKYSPIRVKLQGDRRRRFGVHQASEIAFWVRDWTTRNARGVRTPSYFLVTLPGTRKVRQGDPSFTQRSVDGCTCQATGSTAVARHCDHIRAAMQLIKERR